MDYLLDFQHLKYSILPSPNYTPSVKMFNSLFTHSEISEVAKSIRSMREHWLPVRDDQQLGCFTLGIPHSSSGVASLAVNAQNLNKLLAENFSSFYSSVFNWLSNELQCHIQSYRKNCLPGMIIYEADSLSKGGGAHIDGNVSYLGQDSPRVHEKDLFSLTLPIELSLSPSNLRYWKAPLKDIYQQRDLISHPEKILGEGDVISYGLGCPILHRGMPLHKVEPTEIKKGELRITLQAHGFLIPDYQKGFIFW